MSSHTADPHGAVRTVEFDLLDDDLVPLRASHASTASSASTRSGPASPEAAWFGVPVIERPWVLRGDAATVGAGVRTHELPLSDSPDVPADPSARGAAHGPARRGASAIGWAVGHRDGLEQGRSEGFALGHAEGLAAGSTTGHDRALLDGRTAADAAWRALDSEARRTLDHLSATSEEVASNAAELAFQIAELVLDRELELAADPGAEAVRRAARLLPDTGSAELGTLIARLHPDDLDRLSATPDELVPGRTLQVLADPTVATGGCVLECGATRVDATISSALARIRVALGLETSGAGPLGAGPLGHVPAPEGLRS